MTSQDGVSLANQTLLKLSKPNCLVPSGTDQFYICRFVRSRGPINQECFIHLGPLVSHDIFKIFHLNSKKFIGKELKKIISSLLSNPCRKKLGTSRGFLKLAMFTMHSVAVSCGFLNQAAALLFQFCDATCTPINGASNGIMRISSEHVNH